MLPTRHLQGAVERLEPGQRPEQGALAVADDARDSDDLAAASLEGDVGEALPGQATDSQHCLVVVAVSQLGREGGVQLPPHDECQ